MSFLIRLARRIFKDHFEKNKDFRYGYQSNIAMLLYDRYGITDYGSRNQAANDIMKVIFDAEEIKKKNIQSDSITRFEILDLWEIYDI